MPTKILVVDDEPDLETLILQRFRKQIKDKEFEFFFARDGVEAVELLEQKDDNPIEIVLTDINMPKMDGLTLLSKLADMDRILKTVIVSAYGDMRNIRTAMNRGAFDFLIKPIDFDDLNITIDKTRKMVAEIKRLRDQQHDLYAAEKIQRSILPRTLPKIAGLDIAVGYQPMNIIGGDFYDFHKVDDKHLGIFIADVSGHGVQAALVASMVKVAFTIQHDHAADPVSLLQNMNHTFMHALNETFFTAQYIYVDMETRTLKAASAAHPPLYIWRRKEQRIEEIKASGRLIGWFPDLDCKPYETKLEKGDRLLLFTDGITDPINKDDEQFGDREFPDMIEKMQDVSAAQFTFQVFDSISRWRGAYEENFDDLTLVVIDVLE